MSSSYTLVGLAGKAGSGKDFIASRYLAPLGYHKVSLAWLLKWAAVAQGRMTWEEAFITKPEEKRTILQHMGTNEWRVEYGDDVWLTGIDAICRTMQAEWGIDKFVVADVRFKNELAGVQKYGRVFRVKAPLRNALMQLTPEQRMHKSEIDLDDVPDTAFDAVIHNDVGFENSLSRQMELLVGVPQLALL